MGDAMNKQNILEARLSALNNTASDLIIGLESFDIPEVVYQAKILKVHADSCEAHHLASVALKIEQAAASSNLNAVQALLPELKDIFRRAKDAVP